VSPKERKRRSAVLHELSAHKTKKFYQRFENSNARVLFEEHSSDGVMHGFTENYLRVECPFDENLANKITAVNLKRVSAQTGNMTIDVSK
jgi:threonylcarbamoyladenosine tRNA methylthiotransferase MtaB